VTEREAFWRGFIDGLALMPLWRWIAGRRHPWEIP
jgi:hypothetical protein